jgi:ribosomal protein S27E
MKPGAVKMRYPGNDPENGPAYLQRWDGENWDCAWHKPEYSFETRDVHCKHCGITLMTTKEVKLTINKHMTKLRRK